jgi:hydrogenase maturation protein HypF
MCVETEAALARLGVVADLFLTHDRPIVRPMDDSVARIDSDGLQLGRRARGYVPTAINLGFSGPTILALGGHLKSTIALRVDSRIVVSQHLGDLDGADTRVLHESTVHDLLNFHRAKPEVLVCDLHPEYASTRCAEKLAAEWRIPFIHVQHHHAHIASVMAEHHLRGRVLGFAWDGTGFGTDESIWGGESLLCNDASFCRVATLRPFRLPGGEQAVREPRRAAVGVLHEIDASLADSFARRWFTADERHVILRMLGRGINSPRTTSLGRLFDAVAAMVGLCRKNGFEGQAAMTLEFAAEQTEDAVAYPFPLRTGMIATGDWEPTVSALLADFDHGLPTGVISRRFHNALVEFAVATARLSAVPGIALSGGCFQNLVLQERMRARLRESGFDVYTNRMYPANDGGISLGQVFVAAHQWENAGLSSTRRDRSAGERSTHGAT